MTLAAVKSCVIDTSGRLVDIPRHYVGVGETTLGLTSLQAADTFLANNC